MIEEGIAVLVKYTDADIVVGVGWLKRYGTCH